MPPIRECLPGKAGGALVEAPPVMNYQAKPPGLIVLVVIVILSTGRMACIIGLSRDREDFNHRACALLFLVILIIVVVIQQRGSPGSVPDRAALLQQQQHNHG